MTKVQTLLFPVDFSPACTAMASHVKRAMAVFQAKLTVLHVVEPDTSGYELLMRSLPEADEDRRIAAGARLKQFIDTEFPGLEVEGLVATGEAAARISEAAREHKIDVIAIPSYAGFFRRTLLGSTTAKVLNDADCMVFTSQHVEELSPRPLEHREWTCAIGLTADSARVLRVASELTESIHANLSVVHAIPAAQPGPMVQLDLEREAGVPEAEQARQLLRELQKTAGWKGSTNIVTGSVKDAITEAARKLQADVLVIGRSSQPGALGRLRDLTYAVVRDAPCPVMSV